MVLLVSKDCPLLSFKSSTQLSSLAKLNVRTLCSVSTVRCLFNVRERNSSTRWMRSSKDGLAVVSCLCGAGFVIGAFTSGICGLATPFCWSFFKFVLIIFLFVPACTLQATRYTSWRLIIIGISSIPGKEPAEEKRRRQGGIRRSKSLPVYFTTFSRRP